MTFHLLSENAKKLLILYLDIVVALLNSAYCIKFGMLIPVIFCCTWILSVYLNFTVS